MRNNAVVRGLRALSISVVVLLAVIGSLLLFLPDTGEVPLTAHIADQSTVYLFITTLRAIGLTLVLLASWIAADSAGHLGIWQSTASLSIAAYITALIAVLGCWLFIGMDSDVGNLKAGGGFPLVLFLTWHRAIGLGLLWVASMSVVGIFVGRFDRQRIH